MRICVVDEDDLSVRLHPLKEELEVVLAVQFTAVDDATAPVLRYPFPYQALSRATVGIIANSGDLRVDKDNRLRETVLFIARHQVADPAHQALESLLIPRHMLKESHPLAAVLIKNIIRPFPREQVPLPHRVLQLLVVNRFEAVTGDRHGLVSKINPRLILRALIEPFRKRIEISKYLRGKKPYIADNETEGFLIHLVEDRPVNKALHLFDLHHLHQVVLDLRVEEGVTLTILPEAGTIKELTEQIVADRPSRRCLGGIEHHEEISSLNLPFRRYNACARFNLVWFEPHLFDLLCIQIGKAGIFPDLRYSGLHITIVCKKGVSREDIHPLKVGERQGV